MLLPMLFCITFFGLPLVGMVVLAVRGNASLHSGHSYRSSQRSGQENLHFKAAQKKQRREDHAKTAAFPRTVNRKIIEYQLIESQVHEPLHFRKIKDRAPCRAGP